MNKEEHPLKSTYKRIRKSPKRRERGVSETNCACPTKQRHTHRKKICELVSETFSADRIKFLLQNESDVDWLGQVARVAEKMKKRLQESLVETKNEVWTKNLNDIDIYHLNLTHNPLHVTRETILKLPKLLDKMYTLSSLEVMPYNYRRDHLWLTLQWEIDEIENPFNARPCQSTECLGRFIQCDGDESLVVEKGRLPELLPLELLDDYRDKRRLGMTTRDFQKQLLERIDKQIHFNANDSWAQPKCGLCKMQDLFTMAMDPLRKKHVVSLTEYHTNFCLQFTGMLQQFVINSRVANFSLCISETGIEAPSIEIPLIGLIVNALRRKGKEIIIDNLYINPLYTG